MAHLANRVSAVADPRGPSPAWGVDDAELDEVAAQVRGWRIHLTQLEGGSCAGSVRERVLLSLRLVRVSLTASVALHSSAVGEPDPFQVGFVVPLPERSVWDGHEVREDHLMVADGGGESNLALSKRSVFHVIRMNRGRLHALKQVFEGADAEPRGVCRGLHRVPASELVALRSDVNLLLEDVLASRDAVATAEESIYERVALMLSAPQDSVLPTPDVRRRVLRRAEEYMRAHVQGRISLADLCVAAHCSERTLRYVFRERYGVSPIGFLKRLRLQGLRRDLLGAEPGSTRVLDLALCWGFFHLGHLGEDYRDFFGETPAAALGRPPRAAHPHAGWADGRPRRSRA
jgi:AraC family transcriptional regulator, ethanolamine operon transcriptional activator